MEENIQTPDPQDEDRELRHAFQYAANRDRYDQLAEFGRQLLRDQNIRRTTIRKWLPWVAAGGVALFCLGFWLGRNASGKKKQELEQAVQQQIHVAAEMEPFVFSVTSGEKLVVRMSSGDPSATQPKLEVFSPQGELMGDFYQNDTVHFLKVEQQPVPRQKTQNNKKDLSPKPSPPVVVKSDSTSHEKPKILVADPNNKGRFLASTLPVHRVKVAGEQKTIEPLPAVRVNAFDDPAMRCVFYEDRIRLSVPAKLIEGQFLEILELRGAGAEDGYYLRIGNQFFPLEKSGFSFVLNAVPKPKAFD